MRLSSNVNIALLDTTEIIMNIEDAKEDTDKDKKLQALHTSCFRDEPIHVHFL